MQILGPPMSVQITEKKTRLTRVKKNKATKEDQVLLKSNAIESDDEFKGLYADISKGTKDAPMILEPPFPPRKLAALVQQNNALSPLITAMEVNIDGTGYDVLANDPSEDQEESQKETIDGILDFFKEIYPGESFTTVRRQLRRDQEGVGNAYLEVLRTVGGKIAFARPLEAVTMRLVRLDEPVDVTVKVTRFGQEDNVTFSRRERRFVQKVANKTVYFKEFGATRDLDKETGKWAEEGQTLPVERRATEIIHFYIQKDVNSPYGIPRWISQIPSVLGSRKAEEMNLEFFDAGGLPPALITVMGGELTDPVRKQLEAYLSGKGSSRHRAAIVEAISTTGSLDGKGSSNVRIGVERFGDSQTKDSLFESYDSKCEVRVRTAFRLGPLFVGRTESYNFATAFASYTVAEAQVFEPERQEFDEIINNTIMKEVAPEYKLMSRALTITDVNKQLEALGMVKETMPLDDFYKILGEITNLPLQVPEGLEGKSINDINMERLIEAISNSPTPPAPGQETSTASPPTEPEAGGATPPAASKSDAFELVKLANEWSAYASGTLKLGKDVENVLKERVSKLEGEDRRLFDAYTAMRLMSGYDYDAEGCIEMMSATNDMMCGCVNHAN